MNLNELIVQYEFYVRYHEPLAIKNKDLWELDKINMAKEYIRYLKELKEKTNNIEERIYFTDRELVAVNVVKKEIIGE